MPVAAALRSLPVVAVVPAPLDRLASQMRGGTGGAGVSSTITGSTKGYGGGGGGGAASGVGGTGSDGGGNGGRTGGGTAGVSNTGGGAAVAVAWFREPSNPAPAGGSGVVVVRYAGAAISGVGGTTSSFTGNGTIGEAGVSYQVSTFNSNGIFILSAVT